MSAMVNIISLIFMYASSLLVVLKMSAFGNRKKKLDWLNLSLT